MKKTLFAIAILMASLASQAQGFDWHRANISLNWSNQMANFDFGSGLLRHHPDRALQLGVNYRLWKRTEVGLYATLMGADANIGGGDTLGDGRNVRWLYVDNSYSLGWGAFAQFHVFSFEHRYEAGIDMMLRFGCDFSGLEAKHLWGGLGWNYYITKHLAFTFGTDFGSFRYADANAHLNDAKTWGYRFTVGMFVEL